MFDVVTTKGTSYRKPLTSNLSYVKQTAYIHTYILSETARDAQRQIQTDRQTDRVTDPRRNLLDSGSESTG